MPDSENNERAVLHAQGQLGPIGAESHTANCFLHVTAGDQGVVSQAPQPRHKNKETKPNQRSSSGPWGRKACWPQCGDNKKGGGHFTLVSFLRHVWEPGMGLVYLWVISPIGNTQWEIWDNISKDFYIHIKREILNTTFTQNLTFLFGN